MEFLFRENLENLNDYASLCSLHKQVLSCLEPISSAFFVMLAERALELHADTIAVNCLERFYSLPSVQDQFTLRALFCRSKIEAGKIGGLKGGELIAQVQKAIDYIINAFTLIEVSPSSIAKYAFLVYNGSVIYWNTIRGVIRDSTRGYFVESVNKIISLLERALPLNASSSSSDWDWMAQYYLYFIFFEIQFNVRLLASIYDELGQNDLAITVTTKAVKLNTNLSRSLKETLLRSYVHFNRLNKKNIDAIVSEQEKLEWFTGSKLVVTIQSVLSGVFPIEIFTNSVIQTGNCDYMGEISLIILKKKDLARDAVKKAQEIKSTTLNKSTIYAELASILLDIDDEECVSKYVICSLFDLNSREQACRVKYLKKLEEIIDSANRLNDGVVVECICTYCWNTLLPLMNSRHGILLRSVLNKTVSALYRVMSVKNLLQFQLHCEICAIEMSCDFIDKANYHLKLGFSFDTTAKSEIPPNSSVMDILLLTRPLEAKMMRVKNLLEQKGDLYRQRDDLEEASQCISSANDASDILKKELVKRALSLIDSVKGRDEDRCYLYYELVQLSWSIFDVDKTLVVASRLTSYNWDVRDKSMLIIQAKAYFIQCQASALYLSEMGVLPGQAILVSPEENPFTEEESAQVLKCQSLISISLTKAAEIGKKINEEWIVLQAAVYLFNMHLPLFVNLEHPNSNRTGSSELGLVSSEPSGLLSLELVEALDKLSFDIKEIPNGLLIACSLIEPLALHYENVGNKEKALELCKRVSMASVFNKRNILRIMARCKFTEISKDDRESSLIVLLESALYFSDDAKLNQAAEILKVSTKPSDPVNSEKLSLIEKRADWATKLSELELSLECELNFLAGDLFLKRGKFLIALEYGKKNLASLPNFSQNFELEIKGASDESKRIRSERWRWYSCSCRLIGDSYLALIDPSTQDKSTQDSMRIEALNFYVLACMYSSVNSLTFVCCRLLWNCIIPFSNSALSRSIIKKPLASVLRKLNSIHSEDENEIDLHFKCFCLYLEALADVNDENLVSECEMAMAIFPSKFRNIIISFRNKSSVTSSSSLRNDLLNYSALVKPLPISSQNSSQLVLARAALFIEFANWAIKNQLDNGESKEAFLQAAKTILDSENENDVASTECNDENKSKNSSASKFSRTRTIRSNTSRKSSIRPGSRLSSISGQKSNRAPEPVVPLIQPSLSLLEVLTLVRIYGALCINEAVIGEKENFARLFSFFVTKLWKTSTDYINFLGQKVCLNFENSDLLNVYVSECFDKGKHYCISEGAFVFLSLSPSRFFATSKLVVEFMFSRFLIRDCLPILHLMEYISQFILKNRVMVCFTRLFRAKCFNQLSLNCKEMIALAEPILPTESELRSYREEVEQRESAMSSGLQVQSKINAGDSYHEIWISIIKILVDFGKLSPAKLLLKEVTRHAISFSDDISLAYTYYFYSIITRLEGDVASSLVYAYKMMAYSANINFWKESLSNLTDLLSLTDKNSALESLRYCIDIIGGKRDVNSKLIKFEMVYKLAKLLSLSDHSTEDEVNEGLLNFSMALNGVHQLDDILEADILHSYATALLKPCVNNKTQAIFFLESSIKLLQCRELCSDLAQKLAKLKYLMSATLYNLVYLQNNNISQVSIPDFPKTGEDCSLVTAYLLEDSDQSSYELEKRAILSMSESAADLVKNDEFTVFSLAMKLDYIMGSIDQMGLLPRWKHGTCSLPTFGESTPVNTVQKKGEKEKIPDTTKESSINLNSISATLGVWIVSPFTVNSIVSIQTDILSQFLKEVRISFVSPTYRISACISLANLYGKFFPNETVKMILLAQSYSLRSLAVKFFVESSCFENTERKLMCLHNHILSNLNADSSSEVVSLEKFLIEKSITCKMLDLGNIEVLFSDSNMELLVTKEQSIVSFYYNPSVSNSFYLISIGKEGEFVSRQEFSSNMLNDFEDILSGLNFIINERCEKRLLNENIMQVEGDECDRDYSNLIADLRCLLEPLFDGFPRNLIDDKHVVFLIDSPKLSVIPFESFDIFSRAKSFSRDFSFGLLLKRVQASVQNKKSVRKSSLSYIIDPHSEDVLIEKNKNHGDSLTNSLLKIRSLFKPDEWKGISGVDRVPDVSEYQKSLINSGFLFSGFGSFFSSFSVGDFSCLPCKELSFAHISDRAVNVASHRRLTKQNNIKSQRLKEFESPFYTALAFSLRGVDSILLNTISTTSSNNANSISLLWKELASGATVGTASKMLRGDEVNEYIFDKCNAVLYGIGSVILEK